MNIWVKNINENYNMAKPINNKEIIYSFYWTSDSKYILFVSDNNGNQNYAINIINISNNTNYHTKNVINIPNATIQVLMISKKNPDKLIVSINDRDEKWFDLYELSISTGKLKKLFENK